jgi:signal transduction histidine kinase
MESKRRSILVYALLAGVWLLAAGWQTHEHLRVREAIRTSLRNRSVDIANTLSAFIRGLRFRGTVLQDRLEPVLSELVNARTNTVVKSSELISIILLNAANEPVALAGRKLDFDPAEVMQKGERWETRHVVLVNPVDLGASLTSEGGTNPTVVLPPFQGLTNAQREPGRNPERREVREDESVRRRPPPDLSQPPELGPDSAKAPPPPRRLDGEPRQRRPFWLRGMNETDYESLMRKRALHGLLLVLSTETMREALVQDLWMRLLILLLAGVSGAGLALAWRNIEKTSELQIRLVRASELNSHLRQMNLAAAGLAHETRNPLNIIRGLAQMISKQPDTRTEVQTKSREIITEADKVAAQLNEFINYSRPREVRPAVLVLPTVIGEVVRALNYDLEEKKIKVQINGDLLNVQADEQLLRQALFNLLLNAVQAVEPGGEIEVVVRKENSSEASLEVRDNGPGVPLERKAEIFKPYFTTQKTGTGLGLAVCQQIVLAHGWEITCLDNQPRGAIFRITHLKAVA